MSQNQQLVNNQGVWNNTVQYSVVPLYSIAGELVISCPQVVFDGVIYIATNLNNQPVIGVNPSSSNAWQIAQGQIYDSSKLFTYLTPSQVVPITSTASILQLNSSTYTSQISGNGVYFSINPSNQFFYLSAGYVWTITLTVQGADFSTAADELQLYTSISTDGSTYTDAPVFLRASSIGIGTVGLSVNGSAHSRSIIVDTTTTGYNQTVQVLVKAIVVQSGQTCNLISTNQFSVSVVS